MEVGFTFGPLYLRVKGPKYPLFKWVEMEGEVFSRTGHEGPEGEVGV